MCYSIQVFNRAWESLIIKIIRIYINVTTLFKKATEFYVLKILKLEI